MLRGHSVLGRSGGREQNLSPRCFPGGRHCGPHSDRNREDGLKGQRETAETPTISTVDMDQGSQGQGEHTNSDATAKIQLWLREA